MSEVGGIAGDHLKSFIERIERLNEEKKALSEDIKEVFAEAKGQGFDVKIMRQILKIRGMDADDLDEQEALLDVYMRALGMLPDFDGVSDAREPDNEPASIQAASADPKARRAARQFVDAVVRNPGDSVSLTGPDSHGFAVRNIDGKKIVEQIGAG